MEKKIVYVFFAFLQLTLSFILGFGGAFTAVYLNKAGIIDSVNISNDESNSKEITKETEIEVVREESAIIDVVEKTQNAVVSIIITKDLPIYEDYFVNPFDEGYDFFSDDIFNQFFGQKYRKQIGEEETQIGAGSGFIVTEDGYIVTNKHVVSDADADYTVIFNDGEKASAEIMDVDPYLDIAVLKVDKKDIPYVELGDSDELQVGQTVVAIGYALGEFSNSVSTGIISGLSRNITASSGYGRAEALDGVIQTDASINPGNSGGPLLDIDGNAIGVNVAMAQGAENIGFSIPINNVKSIINSVKEHGKIVRPYLGVRYMPVTKDLKEKNNLPVDYGAMVIRGEDKTDLAVIPGSPASKAGLEEYDIIIEVDGVEIDDNHPLNKEIQKHKVGDKIKVKIMRDNEEKTLEVTLEENELQ